jgi:hypothetical protein
MPTGVADPIETTPRRRPRSARRTSHIDIIFGGGEGGGLLLAGAARDLVTPASAGPNPQVAAIAEVSARLDAMQEVVDLHTTPMDDRVDALVGLPVGRGFRGAVDQLLADEQEAAGPLHLLLDDLPVAALISGYALLYRGDTAMRKVDESHVKADVCSGWRSEGTMLVSLRTTGQIPVPMGPEANELVCDDDPMAWHDIGTLPVGAMRRRRLIDVTGGDPHDVYAMFRDTHVDPDGRETVLHEYSLTATLDPVSLVLSGSEARPHVLPWTECPSAAASAHRLDGHRVSELREVVGREFRGTTTCTHLNDLLRSLAVLGGLTALLPHDS